MPVYTDERPTIALLPVVPGRHHAAVLNIVFESKLLNFQLRAMDMEIWHHWSELWSALSDCSV